MSKKEFLKLRLDLFEFINQRILPKYEELISCNMYELPDEISWDVEYIFKIKKGLSVELISNLKDNIESELDAYLEYIGEDYYSLVMLLIFTEY